MAGRTDKAGAPAPAKRGEAAWQAARDEIAARNAQVSKRGRDERAARERMQMELRRAAERLEERELASRKPDFG